MNRWVPMWVWPLLVVFSTGTVWLRLSIVDTTYMINQADGQIRRLKQELESSNLKIAELRSPKRLEVLARQKFGLRPPQADQLIYLK
jgi:cell division protein FtsL